jgi:hypothetical protein
MTNGGLSCGDHAFPLEYPRYHAIWRHIKYPVLTETPGMVWPCYKCKHRDAVHGATFWTYDVLLRFVKIGLCGFHAHVLKPILPRAHLGEQPVPLRLAAVLKQLNTVD